MKEILPSGYEDPYVDYKGWHLSRFDCLPTPKDSQRWQESLTKLGFNNQIIERRRLQIIMRATVERAIDDANRLMSDSSEIDSTTGFTPVY